MGAHRRAGLLTAALLLATACASGTKMTPVTEGPPARDRRLMDEAARAGLEGRTTEALDKYLEVAGSSGVAALSREAYLQAGLLRLRDDAVLQDISEATRLLRESRTRFDGATEPLVLTATLAVLERLERAERAADQARGLADREAARRDEDARALRRTIAALRQQLDKRDEALRKAAEAAVGPRSR